MPLLPRILPKATLRIQVLFVMARKRVLIPNGVAVSTTAETAAITPPPSLPNLPAKRKISTRTTSGTKHKPSPTSPEAVSVKQLSSTFLEAPEDREASPDEGESQNPDLDDGDQAAQARQPAVNSDILPIPWKGRLGFAYTLLVPTDSSCLNTILRELKPPIFCSRTCRMDTILGTSAKEGKGLDFAKDLGRQNALDLSRISL
jgi:hypothetical protein